MLRLYKINPNLVLLRTVMKNWNTKHSVSSTNIRRYTNQAWHFLRRLSKSTVVLFGFESVIPYCAWKQIWIPIQTCIMFLNNGPNLCRSPWNTSGGNGSCVCVCKKVYQNLLSIRYCRWKFIVVYTFYLCCQSQAKNQSDLLNMVWVSLKPNCWPCRHRRPL